MEIVKNQGGFATIGQAPRAILRILVGMIGVSQAGLPSPLQLRIDVCACEPKLPARSGAESCVTRPNSTTHCAARYGWSFSSSCWRAQRSAAWRNVLVLASGYAGPPMT